MSGNADGGIMLYQVNRTDHPSPYGPHVVKNTDVFGNTVTLTGGTALKVGAIDTTGGSALFSSGNHFHGNTYQLPTPTATSFRWGGGQLNFAGWQRAGQDVDGRVTGLGSKRR
jgi:hypothetical protein